MNTNNGGPAFPPMHDPDSHVFGMTLRDYFAAKAMESLLMLPAPSTEVASKYKGLTLVEFITTRAYEVADDMLRAREV